MPDGHTCGAYALNDSDLCYWHHKSRAAREDRKRLNRSRHVKTSGIVLPLLEDANSIQLAIQMVAQAVADRRITRSESGALLYSIQLAITNLKNVERPRKIYSFRMYEVPTEGDEHEDLASGSMDIPEKYDPAFDDDDEDEEDEDEDQDEDATEDSDTDEDDAADDDQQDEDDNVDDKDGDEEEDEEDDGPANQEEIDYAVAFVKKNMAKLKRLGALPPDMAG